MVHQLGNQLQAVGDDVGQPEPAEASAQAAPGAPHTHLSSSAAALKTAKDKLSRRAAMMTAQVPPLPSKECLQQILEMVAAESARIEAAIVQVKKPPAEDDPNMDIWTREFIDLYRRPFSEVFVKPNFFDLGADQRRAEE